MKALDRQALQNNLLTGVERLHLPLSGNQLTLLVDFLALLVKWNAVYNLTAVRDPQQMITHHLLDSLAAVSAFQGASRVLDVGAGGGLPGMVLAIWALEAEPAMRIDMIDAVHKKTAFLTQVKAELGLQNVTVHTGRVEELSGQAAYDVITSRAFAELADFVTWSGHLLARGGRFIALKGVSPDEEIARLPENWKVEKVTKLQVPELDAERHLVFIRERTE